MAMNLISGDNGGDDELNAAINTTPLVDIMLVLLIIFLITIPVVIQAVPVALPHEVNQPTKTAPQNIVIAIDRAGEVFWNNRRLDDQSELVAKLKERSGELPQPEVHIRADRDVRYEFVGRVVVGCQRAGIRKVAFIVEPDRGTAEAK
jgi:biopolymer transport protein ExbD